LSQIAASPACPAPKIAASAVGAMEKTNAFPCVAFLSSSEAVEVKS